MGRVHLHSGGLSPAAIRAETGGRKRSQWRTKIEPSPAARGPGCTSCREDHALVRRVGDFLTQYKLPPLDVPVVEPKGARGSQKRRKALAAQKRLAACKCRSKKQSAPAAAAKASKATASAAAKTAKKTTKAKTLSTGRGTSASLRSRLSSTDPYQQMLAHDRLRALEQRKRS